MYVCIYLSIWKVNQQGETEEEKQKSSIFLFILQMTTVMAWIKAKPGSKNSILGSKILRSSSSA